MIAMRFPWNRWLVAAALVAALALAAACAGASDDDGAALSGPADGEAHSNIEEVVDESSPGFAAGRDGESAGDAAVAQGAPPSVPATGGSGGALPLPSQIDEKIVYVTTLYLTTDRVSENFENISALAGAFGGYIASSTFGRSDDEETASVTIKVPSDQHDEALARLREFGEVREQNAQSNNVTEEFTDLNSRKRNLEATELRYIEFLDRAEDIGTVLQIQDRINATRLEIEQVQGRITLLENLSGYATITVHLNPPAVEPTKPETGTDSPLEVADEAFEASLAVLLGIATVALAVAAFSWWLVPVLAAGYLVGRRAMRPPGERRSEPPTATM